MGNNNSTPKSSFLSEKTSHVDKNQYKQNSDKQPEKKNEFIQNFKNTSLFSSLNFGNEANSTSKSNDEDQTQNLSTEQNKNSPFYLEDFKNPLDEQTIRNPGTVEDISKLCKEVFPISFDGCRIIFNKELKSRFQVSHTINMNNNAQCGYSFGAFYLGTKMVAINEVYPIILGNIDPSGNLNANVIHQITPRLKGKLVAQFQDYKCAFNQVTTDYKGNTYTASCSLVNFDIVKKSGIIVGSFLKNLTPSLDLGTEIVYQKLSHYLEGGLTAISLVGRYKTSNHVISGNLQTSGLNLCYYKKIDENLQVGVELNTNIQESVASFGYQLNIPKADCNFKGSVNSNYQVCAVLEKKLQPLPLTFMLNGHADYSSNQPNYKYGIGFIVA